MAGEPQHAATEAPVTRSARHDHAVELVDPHLGAQRRVAAGILGGRELLVDSVAVVGCLPHVGERKLLVEAGADLRPRLRTDAGRLNVHGTIGTPRGSCRTLLLLRRWLQSLQLPMVTRPPAASTASLATDMSAT